MSTLFENIDVAAVEADLNALRDELRESQDRSHYEHLRKVSLTGRAFTFLGWATSWIAPNPISALAIAAGISIRWTTVAHHVTHRGYDKVEGVPPRLTSKKFAKGWLRRLIDWPDILDPEGWRHEHNTLHHYKLGEVHDPDQPEHNLEWLRESKLPMWMRYVTLGVGMVTWRWIYYPPNLMRELYEADLRRSKEDKEISSFDELNPLKRPGRDLWLKCWLPYFGLHFILLPLPFALLGPWAYASVLINRAIAEVIANLHTYLIIVPSHAGEDIYRFDTPIEGRGDFYVRQITGSANYRTGGFWNDLFHGWLNYQIEHHLFPDLTMQNYCDAQPRVQEICEKHGVPYVQESVWTRLRKLTRVLVGKDTMKRAATTTYAAPAAPPIPAAAE